MGFLSPQEDDATTKRNNNDTQETRFFLVLYSVNTLEIGLGSLMNAQLRLRGLLGDARTPKININLSELMKDTESNDKFKWLKLKKK